MTLGPRAVGEQSWAAAANVGMSRDLSTKNVRDKAALIKLLRVIHYRLASQIPADHDDRDKLIRRCIEKIMLDEYPFPNIRCRVGTVTDIWEGISGVNFSLTVPHLAISISHKLLLGNTYDGAMAERDFDG
ncbi:hypothetical protein HDU86_007935 [Geranomyces michiganensis]|nr:hypothetical protein HDU86_007935 [Geranomyces michiganensis]